MSYYDYCKQFYEYIDYDNILTKTLDSTSSLALTGASICAEKGSIFLSDLSVKIKKFNNLTKTKKKIRDIFGDNFPYDQIEICDLGEKIYVIFPKNTEVRTTPFSTTLIWRIKLSGFSGVFSVPQYNGIENFVSQENRYFLDVTNYVLEKHILGTELSNINNDNSTNQTNNETESNNLDDNSNNVLDLDDDF